MPGSVKPKAGVELAQSVAETIRRRREALGLSQEEVASQLGLTSDFVGLCERGMRRVGLDRIPQLAEILEVNAKDLAVMALSEEAPLLADVMLQGKLSSNFQLPVRGKAEQEGFRRLMALDRNQRQPILATIDALYDMHSLRKNDEERAKSQPRVAGGGR